MEAGVEGFKVGTAGQGGRPGFCLALLPGTAADWRSRRLCRLPSAGFASTPPLTCLPACPSLRQVDKLLRPGGLNGATKKPIPVADEGESNLYLYGDV